jgi:hypothetical protein
LKNLTAIHFGRRRLVIFDVGRKAKFNCGKMATQAALFNVDGAMIIEKYCDKCAKKIVK